MNKAKLPKLTGWLMLAGLGLIAACGTGEVQTYRPSSYPVYHSPSYYPDLRLQDQDPQFWTMWGNSHGGG